MAIWYVKKVDKNIFMKLFKPIDIYNVDNKIIAQIPDERYAKKLANKIYDKKNQNLVITNNLNKEAFKGICNILDGRLLFKYMILQILQYVFEKGNADALNQEISLMINTNSQSYLKQIAKIAPKVKMLNIITENINGFNGLENYLLNEKGIAIRVTNNKRKALLKSRIIFNIDFPADMFNKYYVPRKSIIIHTSEKIGIKSKSFEGVNCNYYNIELPLEFKKWFKDNELFGLVDETVLLESMIYYKNSYEYIENILTNIKINYLIGNNGIIQAEEIIKIFT